LLANMLPLEDKSMFSIKIYCLSGKEPECQWKGRG
jgi:hypothetical protein